MADSPIGEIPILITGDFSDLDESISQAASAAQEGASQIAEAFDISDLGSGITESLQALGSAVESASADFDGFGAGFDDAASGIESGAESASKSISGISDSTEAASSALEDLGSVAADAGDAVEEAGSSADEAGGSLEDAAGSASDLSDSLDEAGSSADDAAASLSSIADAADSIGSSADDAASSVGDISSAAADASSAADDLDGSLSDVSGEAEDAAGGLDDLSESTESAAESAREAEGGFEGMAEQLETLGEALVVTEGLHELGTEALEVYGSFQQADIALTALTGSAEVADNTITSLKALSVSDALSFPSLLTATQRMQMAGVQTSQLSGLLEAAANAGIASGRGFDTASQAITRMVGTGQVGTRQLQQLGISSNALAAALGVDANQITTAFKALDRSQEITVLETAMSGLQGIAQTAAQGISGQWTILGTNFELVMEGIGEAIAPVITEILKFANDVVLPAVQSMIEDFNELPGPVKNAVTVLGLLTAATAAAAAGFAALSVAQEAWAALLGSEAAEASTAAAATAALGTAAESSAAGMAAAGVAAGEAGAGMAEAGAAAEETGAFVEALSAALPILAAAVVAVGVAWLEWDQLKTIGADLQGFSAQAVNTAETLGGELLSAVESVTGALPGFGSAWQTVKDSVSNINWAGVAAGILNLQQPLSIIHTFLVEQQTELSLVSGSYADMASAAQANLSRLSAANATAAQSMSQLAQAQAQGAAAAKAQVTSLSQLVQTQSTLNSALVQAKQTLADANAAYGAGAVSLNVVQAAQQAVTKAQNALNTSVGEGKTSVEGLTTSWQAAQTAFQSAVTAFQSIQAAFQAGTISAGAYDAALQKVEASAKSAGATFTNYAAIAQGVINAANNQSTALTTQIGVLAKLQSATTESAEGWTAWNNQVKAVTSLAAAMGITITQTANGVVASVTNMSDESAPAIQKLVDSLNQMLGASTQASTAITGGSGFTASVRSIAQAVEPSAAAVQNFNGIVSDSTNNLTGWMAATTDATAQITILKGGSDSAAQSLGGLNSTIINTNGSTETLAQLLQQLNTQQNAATTAANNASNAFGVEVQTLQQLSTAADNAANAMDNLGSANKSSGGGGGGGGGGTGGMPTGASLSAFAMSPATSGFVTEGGLPGIFGEGAEQIADTMASVDSFRSDVTGAADAVTKATTAVSSSTTATQASTTAASSNTTAVATNTAAVTASTQAATTAASDIAGNADYISTSLGDAADAASNATQTFSGFGPALDSTGNFVASLGDSADAASDAAGGAASSFNSIGATITQTATGFTAASEGFTGSADTASDALGVLEEALVSAGAQVNQFGLLLASAPGTQSSGLAVGSTAPSANQGQMSAAQIAAAITAAGGSTSPGTSAPAGQQWEENSLQIGGGQSVPFYELEAGQTTESLGSATTQPISDSMAALGQLASQVTQTVDSTGQFTESIGSFSASADSAAQALQELVSVMQSSGAKVNQFGLLASSAPGTSAGALSSSTGLNLSELAAAGLGTNYAGSGLTPSQVSPNGVNLSVTIQAGTVVGQGGMQQLAQTVGQTVIQQMKGTTGLKLF